jgi:hypothetical protein
MAATFHSALILGISLWAVFRPSLTPVRNLIVRGISPSALFIPVRIFPSFPAASSTVSSMSIKYPLLEGGRYDDVRAEPLPVRKTRSIGQPQFKSIKSMPRPHSFIIVSAVGTRVAGLLPATCTPNIVSDGCRLTKDHSSLEPERKDVARPTDRLLSVSQKIVYRVQKTPLTFSTSYISSKRNAKPSEWLECGLRKCDEGIILRCYTHKISNSGQRPQV